MKIDIFDCAKILDFDTSSTFYKQTEKIFNLVDTSYYVPSEAERDRIIIEILSKIEADSVKSGPHRKKDWSQGWEQNLNNLISTKNPDSALIPGYYKPNNICRWKGKFIISKNPNLEFRVFELLRRLIFHKFLANAQEIYEFGAGSCHNLLYLSKEFPEKKLIALDWVESSTEIANSLQTEFGRNIFGQKFDFFNPSLAEPLSGNSNTFLTVGGLEQVGNEIQKFVVFTLTAAPNLCVHIEPLFELYQNPMTNLVEYLGYSFHKKKKYLTGLIPSIQNLEKQKRAKIHHLIKFPFGGKFHDGWSILIWEPRNN